MARSSPQSFQKRQRERQKAQKRAEKLERRVIRNWEKQRAKEEAGLPQEAREPEDPGGEPQPEE